MPNLNPPGAPRTLNPTTQPHQTEAGGHAPTSPSRICHQCGHRYAAHYYDDGTPRVCCVSVFVGLIGDDGQMAHPFGCAVCGCAAAVEGEL